MFEILFLGTSASAPSAKRGLSSQIVAHNEYRFLVDCGEGTQRQILQSGAGFKRLNHILLTHGHLDHILGLGGLLSTFLRWEAIEELNIYAGAATLERVKALVYDVVLRGNRTPMPLNLHEIKPGPILDAEDFTVSAFPVTHRGPDCLGYVFEGKPKRPFLAEKADAFGVPFGPERKELVAGKAITLTNGQRVTPEDVLGAWEKGSKLVVVGDTGRTENLLEVCKDADALVIESTYLDADAEMARQFAHLTAKMGAELAKKAGVKKLILTHISRRYREKDVIAEAQSVFPNTAVARDFDTYQVKRDDEDGKQKN
ncbi:MAG: ribonuclease Z [Anaerolineales bacterium]|nr:ribonuclease Z [Anaerolineales bacterium]